MSCMVVSNKCYKPPMENVIMLWSELRGLKLAWRFLVVFHSCYNTWMYLFSGFNNYMLWHYVRGKKKKLVSPEFERSQQTGSMMTSTISSWVLNCENVIFYFYKHGLFLTSDLFRNWFLWIDSCFSHKQLIIFPVQIFYAQF